jgi:hypothetical protein
MTKTLWAIFWSTLYITYLGAILPFYGLFLIIANSARMEIGIDKLRRNLRKNSVPRHLRKEITKTYRKSFSLNSMLKHVNVPSIGKRKETENEQKEEKEGIKIVVK